MPNLVITNTCNLSCPFCFASEYRADPADRAAARMTVEEFERQLQFAGADTVRFCGGEPTLHPDFLTMLDIALSPDDRGVFLMTNGLWPDAVRQRIADLPSRQARRITFLVNVLSSDLYTPQQRERLDATLHQIHPKQVTLGVTLYEPSFETDPLFAFADRFGIRHLRYSVAAPNITDPRSWSVDPDRDFRLMAAVVHRLVMGARRRKFSVHSDCGYIPPCMFTDEQLADLSLTAESFHCSGPVDIGPGGQAWRCYGLYSSVRARTDDFAHAGALADHFARRTDLLAERFLFDACETCDLRARGACGGGCYAFRSVRTMRAACAVSMEDDAALLAAVVGIDEDNLHLSKRGAVMLRESDGGWMELQLTEVERRILRACDPARTVGSLVDEVDGVDVALVTGLVRRLFDHRAVILRRG